MNELTLINKTRTIFFWLSLLVGISLRLWVSTIGNNFDLESYWLVSEAVVKGRSVYAETTRYNYGPIWYLLLGNFRQIAGAFYIDNIYYFHILIAAFLTIVDVTIALMLRRSYGASASLFFFLNPVSILITGYHSQFDNFAILLAFAACSRLARGNTRADIRKTIFSMALLGLSLATKHICLFLPFWLWWAYRDESVKIRTSILLVSYGIFGLLFLPFALDPNSVAGIIRNVCKYGSFYGNGLIFQFLNLFVDISFVETYFKLSFAKGAFIFLAIFSGAFWTGRVEGKYKAEELFFIYIIILVAFTPSMADQYLAIPLIALARYHKYIAVWLYSLAGTVVLLSSPTNIMLDRFSELRFIGYQQVQTWLAILLLIIWRQCREEQSSPIFIE